MRLYAAISRCAPLIKHDMNGKQSIKPHRLLLEASAHFLHSCRNPRHAPLPEEVRAVVIAGASIFQWEGWEDEIRKMEDLAKVNIKQFDGKSRERWKQWAASTFPMGQGWPTG